MAKVAKDSPYYDLLYRKQTKEDKKRTAELNAHVLPFIIGYSILDLGCGTGDIANLWPKQYMGIDFSKGAIAIARANCHNPNAVFYCIDLRKCAMTKQYDTVLLLEVLEHLDDPAYIADIALRTARLRIIITVPRDMPGRAHVKAAWMPPDLEKLFGPLSVCELFGGPDDDRWWLAVKDVGQ